MPVYKEWVVLDALNHIKDTVDGTLTYRWSCRMGICGSCGMMVNGEPKLTCATFLSSYAKNGNKIRVEPLRYFPIMRDLVTRLSDFLVKLKKVKPWLIRKDDQPLSQGEFLQTPEQVDRYKQFSMCINCTLCYAACPVVGLDPVFVGPAAIALAQRYNLDSRDQGAAGTNRDIGRIPMEFGAARLSANAPGFVPSMWIRQARSSSTRLRRCWTG